MKFLGLVALGAAGLTATPALAGSSVSTYSDATRGWLRGCAASYNSGSTGSRIVVDDGSMSPCDTAGFQSSQGATITINGSTDTTGTLTAANDSVSLVAGGDAAVATSSSDLSTATIKLFASAANFSSSTASGSLTDVLHFTIAGADASTVTYIPVSFSFTGSILPGSDPNTASAEINYGFSFGDAHASEFGDYGAGYYGIYGNYPVPTYASAPSISGWVSGAFTSYDPLDTSFSGIYAITGASADIAVGLSLGLRATNVGLDFTKGDTITIGKVAGVSYTSDSGVFGTPSALPEPASWMLMILGFGAIGAALRQQRRGKLAFA